MSRRSFKVRYLKYISEYKKLEKEKKKCLQLYFNNQTLIQVHYANIIRSLNIVMSLSMLDHFQFTNDILLYRPIQRKCRKTKGASNFWEEEVPMFSEDQFKEHFRMSRGSFEKLCNKLFFLAREDTKIRKEIPLDKRIAIALNALGSSSSYRLIADKYGVGRTTVGELVMKFAKAVCEAMQDEYLTAYPPTLEKIEEVVNGFERMGIPQCYGVVDTWHVKISANRSYPPEYLNSAGWYSVILLATVDYRGQFSCVEVGLNGCSSDRLAYEKSELKKIHESNELLNTSTKIIEEIQVPIYLVGSSSFCLSKHLMKPYTDNDSLSDEAEMFNNILSQCQGIILDTFEYMKARFVMISRGLEVRENNCHTIIKACCILNNFLNNEHDFVWGSWVNELEERENNGSNVQPAKVVEQDIDNKDGIEIREAVASYICRQME